MIFARTSPGYPKGRSPPMIKKLARQFRLDAIVGKSKSVAVVQPQALRKDEASVFQGTGASTAYMRESRRRQTMLAKVSALLCVIVPTLLVAIYATFFAADQFVVESRFAARSSEQKNIETLGALAGIPSNASNSDSFLLVDYIRSAELMREVDKELNLKAMFADKGDFYARIAKDAPIEDMLEYWQEKVRARVDSSSQSVVMSVRAFSGHDAMAVANLVLVKSEQLVNRLSEKARNEAVSSALKDVRVAEDRLRTIREKMRQYRDVSRVMDPTKTVIARQELIGKIQAELATMSSELRSLRRFLSEDAPSLIALKTRISALEAELQRIRTNADATDAGGDLPAVIQSFENLQTENIFAEKAYTAVMAAYERARIDADRNSKYLAVHVRPSEPETAVYPKRIILVLSTLILAFLAWGSGWLIFLSVRDHMH